MDSAQLAERFSAAANSSDDAADLQSTFLALSGPGRQDLISELKSRAFDGLWGDTEEAERLGRLIQQLGEWGENAVHQALGLRVQAQAQAFGFGDYAGALDTYDAALKIYRQINDPIRMARLQVSRVWALAMLGRFDEVRALEPQTRKLLLENKQWQSLASFHNNLALAYNRVGDFHKSLEMLDAAYQAYLDLGPEGLRFLPQTAANKALAYFKLGRYQEALRINLEALRLAHEHQQPTVVARVRQNLGSLYCSMGNLTKGLQLIIEAEEQHRALGQDQEVANCRARYMVHLLEAGHYDPAIERCQALREDFSGLGRHHEVGETWRDEGSARLKLRQFSQAKSCLAEAGKVFEQEHNLFDLAEVELILADLHYQSGHFEDALNCGHRSEANYLAVGNLAAAAKARLLLANVFLAMSDFSEAESYLDKARGIVENQKTREFAYEVHLIEGQLAKAVGNKARALEAFKEAVAVLEAWRSEVFAEYQPYFLQGKSQAYEEIVELLFEDSAEEAFRYVELAKSRVLLDLLLSLRGAEATADGFQGRPGVDRLRDEWRQHTQANADWEAAEDLARIEGELNELWRRESIRQARDHAVVHQFSERLSELPVSNEEVLLEYFAIGERCVVFLIKKENENVLVQAILLESGASELAGLIDSLRAQLQGLSMLHPEQVHRSTAALDSILEQLYDILVAPIEGFLDSADHLFIVPHGVLHHLPFAALRGRGQYLVECYSLSYLPSAASLEGFQTVEPQPVDALVLAYSGGGRLPSVIAEAEAIADVFKTEPLLEAEANQAALAELTGMSLIHFAAHAEARQDNPLFYRLALSDGWLTALDVFSLNLSASLVTLSACESGYNRIGGGDEIMGLVRAFLEAGARSVVASLWPVMDESTRFFMQVFYQQLAIGKGKAEALQTAQCTALAQGDFGHPLYWAAFYVLGDHRRL